MLEIIDIPIILSYLSLNLDKHLRMLKHSLDMKKRRAEEKKATKERQRAT